MLATVRGCELVWPAAIRSGPSYDARRRTPRREEVLPRGRVERCVDRIHGSQAATGWGLSVEPDVVVLAHERVVGSGFQSPMPSASVSK